MLIAGERGYRGTVIVLWTALLVAMVASLGLGRYPIAPATVIQVMTMAPDADQNDPLQTERVVVRSVRLPRVVAATAAGVGLALGGTVLQALFRNPLVGPQVVGISNGAALGGVVAMFFGWHAMGVVAAAFATAFGALLIVFTLNRVGSGGILGTVLAGVIVSSFASALVGLIQFMADPERQLPGIVYWLLGSFATITPESAWVVVWPTAAGAVVLWLLRWRVNLLSLDDADAQALGVDVTRLRWAVIAIVTFMVAAQVAVSGSIGWVGLVIPHLARALVGPDHRRLVPVAAVLGGMYLLAMDGIARTFADEELPLGVLTALVGTPVFAVIFWRTQANGWLRD